MKQEELKTAYIQGYIDACEMHASFGFDEGCNEEMVEALEDFLNSNKDQANCEQQCGDIIASCRGNYDICGL